jgi:hypothetical protein
MRPTDEVPVDPTEDDDPETPVPEDERPATPTRGSELVPDDERPVPPEPPEP